MAEHRIGDRIDKDWPYREVVGTFWFDRGLNAWLRRTESRRIEVVFTDEDVHRIREQREVKRLRALAHEIHERRERESNAHHHPVQEEDHRVQLEAHGAGRA